MNNYELTEDKLRFLLGITHNGRRRAILATMKPYEPGHMIALLKEREASFVVSGTDSDALDVQPGNRDANAEFFDRYKIGIQVDGLKASEALIAKLDALYKVKNGVIAWGYMNIREVKPDPAASGGDLESELGETISAKQIFTLADEAGKEADIEIEHVTRFVTAEDRLRWDRAQRIQQLKEGGHRTRYNYEHVGHLYDAMSKEARGFTVNGVACTEANKPDWIKLIPYIFKFRALDSIFGQATGKNG
jgi:hypothetical protein